MLYFLFSQEVLVQELLPGSSKSLCSNPGEESFWIPPPKRGSLCPSDNEEDDTSPGIAVC